MYSHVHKLKTVPFSPALVIGLDDSRGNDLATFVGEEEEEEEVKSLHAHGSAHDFLHPGVTRFVLLEK